MIYSVKDAEPSKSNTDKLGATECKTEGLEENADNKNNIETGMNLFVHCWY